MGICLVEQRKREDYFSPLLRSLWKTYSADENCFQSNLVVKPSYSTYHVSRRTLHLNPVISTLEPEPQLPASFFLYSSSSLSWRSAYLLVSSSWKEDTYTSQSCLCRAARNPKGAGNGKRKKASHSLPGLPVPCFFLPGESLRRSRNSGSTSTRK